MSYLLKRIHYYIGECVCHSVCVEVGGQCLESFRSFIPGESWRLTWRSGLVTLQAICPFPFHKFCFNSQKNIFTASTQEALLQVRLRMHTETSFFLAFCVLVVSFTTCNLIPFIFLSHQITFCTCTLPLRNKIK